MNLDTAHCSSVDRANEGYRSVSVITQNPASLLCSLFLKMEVLTLRCWVLSELYHLWAFHDFNGWTQSVLPMPHLNCLIKKQHESLNCDLMWDLCINHLKLPDPPPPPIPYGNERGNAGTFTPCSLFLGAPHRGSQSSHPVPGK